MEHDDNQPTESEDCDPQLMAVMCKAQDMLLKGGDLFPSLTVGNFSFIAVRLSVLGVPQELISDLMAQAMECPDFYDSLVCKSSSEPAPSSSSGLASPGCNSGDFDPQLAAVLCKAQDMLTSELIPSLTEGNFTFIAERLSALGVPQDLISDTIAQAMKCQELFN